MKTVHSMIIGSAAVVCMAAFVGCNQPKPADPSVTDIAKTKEAAASINPKKMTRLAIMGSQMTGENVGKIDGKMSYRMTNNGSIRATDIWANGGINEMAIKAHGTIAAGAWPKINVRLINTKLAKPYDLVEGLSVDSAQSKMYGIPLAEPLPAGNYIADIYFTNNADGIPEFSKEDRNVWIDMLVLNPNAPKAKDDLTTSTLPTEKKNAATTSPLQRNGKDMKGDNGRVDGNSWLMWSNGKLLAQNLYSNKAIKAIKFNAHGIQAAGIWPTLQVRVVHTSNSMLAVAFDSLSIDSAESKTFTKEFDPPLEVGNFNAEFIFLNNSEGIPAGSKEDRNVWIDSVELIQL